jgi:predicted dienelactone hydrolase
MADYDPFSRGPHPVGVRSVDIHDAARDRTLPIEIWYPATDRYAGHDLDPATRDTYEMMSGITSTQDAVRDVEAVTEPGWPIVFSHGLAGHRRQSTSYCTHLASHGFVVAAPDHVGNTTADVMTLMMEGAPDDYMEQVASDRPDDASRTLDAMLSGELGVATLQEGAGMTGHSFGGWTTLQTTGRDDRIVAAVPLAPAGGRSGGPSDRPLADLLDLDWTRHVPVLMVVADEDTVLPYAGMEDILRRSPAIEELVVIENAEHFHFCDNAEVVHDMMAPLMGGQTKTSAEFVPGAHAHDVVNGLGLARFDATLRGRTEADDFLGRDPAEVLAERDIAVHVVSV